MALPFLPQTVFQDLRYAARMIYRNAGFAAVAILALALGIGVNTTVFTAYKAMVLRHLDARNPSEMVNIALVRYSGATDFRFSYPDYEAYRDSAHSFTGLIAINQEHMALSGAGGIVSQRASTAGSQVGRLGLISSGARNAEFASVFVVSENYFDVLGGAPVRGQTFNSSPSVLISENYWQRRFAGDPSTLGKTVRLNEAAVTIVGITPRDFVGTNVATPDFWLPLHLVPLVHANDQWLHERENLCCRLFGRLAPGVTISQARAEMALLTDHLRALHDPHSEWAKPATVLVWPGSPFPLPINFYGGLKLAILLIMAAAGMVLAVACANVASLQLARARSRENELRTRLSLGASRMRIFRQLLTESALLGLLAGAVAFAFTNLMLRVAVALAAQALPAEDGTLVFNVNPDLAIFAYVFGVSLLAGILFGIAPALESSRSALSSGVRQGTSPVGSRRLQDLLISAQVALSLVLMIAGSMLIRSSVNSLKMDTGYDGKHVINLEIQFPEASRYSLDRKLATVQELRTRLAAVPGVAAVTSAQPPTANGFRTPVASQNGQAVLHYTYVQPNYFHTLGIPLLLGRVFPLQAEHSVILSESAARQLWAAQSPIGHSLRLGAPDEQFRTRNELPPGGPAYQVIGVARDTRGVEFDGSDASQVYLPLPEDRIAGRPILIRTQSDPAAVIQALDPVISSVDPDLVVTGSTLDDMLRLTAPFIASSMAAAIAVTVGFLGLLLAAIGIYGTVSYIVVLRTREVGIRMAIGAQKRDILGLMLRETAKPVLTGLLSGMCISVGTSYLLRGLFVGVNIVDAISYAGMALLFLAVALTAAYPPSRRAMRIDPMEALRYE